MDREWKRAGLGVLEGGGGGEPFSSSSFQHGMPAWRIRDITAKWQIVKNNGNEPGNINGE